MKNIFDTRRVRPNEIIVDNTYAGTIPANSFARIISYDKLNQHFNIGRPGADYTPESTIVIIPEAIPAAGLGVGIIDGIGTVRKTSGETIVTGDSVGTDSDEFTAILGSGGFRVLYYDSGSSVCVLKREAGKEIRKAFCKYDAGAGIVITCYLDVDGTGDEITVKFGISQGGVNVNEALPRLKDGDPVFVYQIGADWYCVQTLTRSEDCDCYEEP